MLAVLLFGCEKVTQKKVYTANAPVYMSYETLRSSIKNNDSQTLSKPGKIFLYNQYILVNDFETGVHIYDNSNPLAPVHKAFIQVPGNVDIAVKNDVLYVDSYVDLVAIDLSDPNNAREVARAANALSYTIPSSIDWRYPVSQVDQQQGVVIGYTVREVEETCKDDECGYYYHDNFGGQENMGPSMMSDQGTVVSFSGNTTNVRSAIGSNTNGALAGSMARFMLVNDYLYVISDESTVKVFNIASGGISEVTTFKPWDDSQSWGMIETLFTLDDHLFIGSNSGMLAYDISNPADPQYLSIYTHMTACDPVVANELYAFVTLRAGTTCGMNNSNQLDVLDIRDIMNPRLLTTHPMTSPHGLALDRSNELLFVCDGSAGLKVYKTDNVAQMELSEVGQATGLESFDVISHRGIAHVIGREGLVQYQYDASGTLNKLSTIPLN